MCEPGSSSNFAECQQSNQENYSNQNQLQPNQDLQNTSNSRLSILTGEQISIYSKQLFNADVEINKTMKAVSIPISILMYLYLQDNGNLLKSKRDRSKVVNTILRDYKINHARCTTLSTLPAAYIQVCKGISTEVNTTMSDNQSTANAPVSNACEASATKSNSEPLETKQQPVAAENNQTFQLLLDELNQMKQQAKLERQQMMEQLEEERRERKLEKEKYDKLISDLTEKLSTTLQTPTTSKSDTTLPKKSTTINTACNELLSIDTPCNSTLLSPTELPTKFKLMDLREILNKASLKMPFQDYLNVVGYEQTCETLFDPTLNEYENAYKHKLEEASDIKLYTYINNENYEKHYNIQLGRDSIRQKVLSDINSKIKAYLESKYFSTKVDSSDEIVEVIEEKQLSVFELCDIFGIDIGLVQFYSDVKLSQNFVEFVLRRFDCRKTESKADYLNFLFDNEHKAQSRMQTDNKRVNPLYYHIKNYYNLCLRSNVNPLEEIELTGEGEACYPVLNEFYKALRQAKPKLYFDPSHTAFNTSNVVGYLPVDSVYKIPLGYWKLYISHCITFRTGKLEAVHDKESDTWKKSLKFDGVKIRNRALPVISSNSSHNIIQVCLGSDYNLMCFDIDKKLQDKAIENNGYTDDEKHLLNQLALASGWVENSPNGKHIFFAYSSDVIAIGDGLAQKHNIGFEIKNKNGNGVTVSPSSYYLNNTLKRYELVKFTMQPIVPIPDNLKQQLKHFLESRGIDTTIKTKITTHYEGPTKLERKWLDLLSVVQSMNLCNENRMKVLFAYSQIDNSEEMWQTLNFWNQISHSRYDEHEWKTQWENAVNNTNTNKSKITIRSIIDWAKKNNPDGYAEWKRLYMENSWLIVNRFTQGNLADYFYEKNKRKIFNSNGKWYVFNKNTNLWTIDEKQDMIKNIMDFFKKKLNKRINEKRKELEYLVKTGQKQDAITNIIAQLETQIDKIDTTSYAEGIARIIGKLFRRNIEMNSNPYIWAFQNGVYDLKENVFRPIEPEDLITKVLPYDFDQYYQPSSDVLDKIRNLCPDEVWKYFAYCATGKTCFKTNFLYFVGEANTGKSTMARIYKEVFPIYFLDIDSATFDNNSAIFNKQAGELEGVRLAFIDEASDNKKSSAIMKKITEGVIALSPLYQNTKTIQIPTKFILCSNEEITEMDVDSGILERFLLYKPTTKFEDDKNKIIEFDKLFRTKEYRHAYIHIIRPFILEMIKNNSLQFPTLKLNFKEHVYEYNRFQQIIQDHLIVTSVNTDRLTKQELLILYQTLYPNTKISEETIIKEFKKWNLKYERTWTKNNIKGVFVGVRMKTSQDRANEQESSNEANT